MSELWLIRHGETEWSRSGQHTGATDIPLTAVGEQQALALGRFLQGREFSTVLVSPLARARRTCELAGLGAGAQVDPDLHEWKYGDYEGLTSQQIREARPNWSVWEHGVVGGETIEQVATRAHATMERAAALLQETPNSNVALFAHGHLLRILATCWLDLHPSAARQFLLGTATVSVLGYEHATRAIRLWNWSANAHP
jgi:broad specificity phosphatase PhoE